MPSFRDLFIAALLVGLVSCTPSPAEVNAGTVRMVPLSEYRIWWREVEGCSKTSGDFDRVEWYRAETFGAGNDVVGQWSPPHSITVRFGYEYNETVVKHEILHDLLDGDRFHDEPAWITCNLPIG